MHLFQLTVPFLFLTTVALSAKAPSYSLPSSDSTESKRSVLARMLNYFNDANKNKKNRKFDFSIIGGPHYSTDAKLGLGLVAAGLYRTSAADSLLPPSNISLYGDVSTVGFYLLGIRGNHLFPQDRYRINYTSFFYYFPSKFWGMGYENGNNSDNESKLHRWQAAVNAAFLFRLAPHFYAGPMAAFDYVKATQTDRPELLDGQHRDLHNLGIGLSAIYDSRDAITCPHEGFYVDISQCFRPRFLGNRYAFSTTTFCADAYRRVWKGGILATDVRGSFNFGNPSWAMMAKLGNPSSMRGYYEGRYRDKHKLEAQIELRQHVWRRNGIVLWGGAGCVFPKFSALRTRHILPNYGLGYRWEFKKDVNIRLDYGFGKAGQSGFLFNINEAF